MKKSAIFAAVGTMLATAPLATAQDVSSSSAPVVSTGAASAAPQVSVVWPKDKDNFPFLHRSFTFGTVTAGSTLTINGQPARVDSDGAFFEMIPMSSGAFLVRYDAMWQGVAVSTQRVVNIAPPGGIPDLGPMDALALEPSTNRELSAGQIITVRCKGPTGLAGAYSIQGLVKGLPLLESSGTARGLYSGFYIVQPQDRGADMAVECRWKAGFFKSVRAEARGKISIAEPTRTRAAVTTPKWSVIKSQAGGYSIFLPDGIRLEVAGRDGALARVILAEDLDGWIDASALRFLPDGTLPPRGTVGQNVSTSITSDTVRVAFEISERLAFEVRQTADPLSYTIRFFGAAQRFDRMKFAQDDPVIRDIRWRQERTRVLEVTIDTFLKRGWGYNASYDAAGRFVFEIVRPPHLVHAGKTPKNVLAGRRIVVDPGHGPEPSAIGPRGTTERDVNLAIAFRLRALLAADGADPYMIRTSTEGPALTDRPIDAWKARGELYVSIHNNALPVSADPFAAPRGFMLFYYHPSSRPLAEAMHRSYLAYLSELPDEGMQWGDLQVCRTTTMPAILTETAYMIFPNQEKMLMDPSFQERVAKLLLEGIRTFYEDYRSIQAASPTEQRAARESGEPRKPL